MSTMTLDTSRTAHLLELMKKGDDAFNSRDVAGMNATHHPDIIAHIMGIPKPIKGRKAHAAMIQEMIGVFPAIHVHNNPYPNPVRKRRLDHRNHPRHRDIHRKDDSAQRQSDRPDGKGVRPHLQHDRSVGGRRAHRRVRLLGPGSSGAADRARLGSRLFHASICNSTHRYAGGFMSNTRTLRARVDRVAGVAPRRS